MNQIVEQLRPLVQQLFAVDSVWSIVLRFGVWVIIAITIIVSVDAVRPDQQSKNLKANLGLFLLFLILSGVVLYLIFGVAPGL